MRAPLVALRERLESICCCFSLRVISCTLYKSCFPFNIHAFASTFLFTHTWHLKLIRATVIVHPFLNHQLINSGFSFNSSSLFVFFFIYEELLRFLETNTSLILTLSWWKRSDPNLPHVYLLHTTGVLRYRPPKLLLAWKSTTSASGSTPSCEMSSTRPVVRNHKVQRNVSRSNTPSVFIYRRKNQDLLPASFWNIFTASSPYIKYFSSSSSVITPFSSTLCPSLSVISAS